MAAVWLLEMPPVPKAVLVSLADNANDHGECWPSIAYTARRTCLSERSVQRAIQWLVTSGLLVVELKTGRSTRYTVTPPSLISLPPTQRHPRQRVTPDGKSGAPVTQSPRGCQRGTLTVKEPPLTKSRAGDKSPKSEEPNGRQPPAAEVLAKSRTTKPATPAQAAAHLAAIAKDLTHA